jgi:hypothetical protein
VDAGGDDTRVVDDDQLPAPQFLRKIYEAPVTNLAGLALEDEQSRLVPSFRGVLGDQLGRKLVLELRRLHPTAKLAFVAMAPTPIQWAQARLEAVKERADWDAEIQGVLERARAGIEDLAATAAELQAALPEQVEQSVREGVRSEAAPVARQLAEVRGIGSLTVRRLEALAGQVEAERHARLDDLAVLVDLIASGYQGIERRLERIEDRLPTGNGAWLQALG